MGVSKPAVLLEPVHNPEPGRRSKMIELKSTSPMQLFGAPRYWSSPYVYGTIDNCASICSSQTGCARPLVAIDLDAATSLPMRGSIFRWRASLKLIDTRETVKPIEEGVAFSLA